jgi:hypothetical protein
MLARLGHYRIVRSNNQKRYVDSNSAREHVLDEAFVTGDVDYAQLKRLQIEMGKSYVDSNPAPLLLREAVAVDAGQRAQKGSFPMVDVTGSSQNQRVGIHLFQQDSNRHGAQNAKKRERKKRLFHADASRKACNIIGTL